MKFHRVFVMLPVFAIVGLLPKAAVAQSIAFQGDGPTGAPIIAPRQPDAVYVRPTQGTIARNYFFDAYGPYPTAGAAIEAGIDQAGNAPPEWRQGLHGYAMRFGSDYGIAATGTTARYGLAEALKEDTLYYRCECRGVLPPSIAHEGGIHRQLSGTAMRHCGLHQRPMHRTGRRVWE
jgi:hypothetical protein